MLRSWKLIGRPVWSWPIAWMLQPPMNASASRDARSPSGGRGRTAVSKMPLTTKRCGTSNSDSRSSYSASVGFSLNTRSVNFDQV